MSNTANITSDESDVFRYLENAPIGIMLARQTKIIWANNTILEMINYKAEEIINHLTTEIVPERMQQEIHERGIKRESGEALTKKYETVLMRKDGSEIPVYIHVDIIQFDQQPTSMVFFTDLRELKISQEALAKSLKGYQVVVENQSEFIVCWNNEGIRTYVNPAYCKYFKVSENEVIGQKIVALMESEKPEDFKEYIHKITLENPSVTSVEQVTKPDNSKAWIEWTDTGIFDSQGKLIEIHSVGRDITELKKSKDNATKNESAFRSLFEHSPVATIVHDFSLFKKVCEENNFNTFEEYIEFSKKHPELELQDKYSFKRIAINSAYLETFHLNSEKEFYENEIGPHITEQTRPNYRKCLNYFLSGGHSYTFKTSVELKDGNTIEVIVKRSIDPNTELPWQRIYTSFVDITEVKESKELTKKSEEYFKDLLDQNKIPTVVHDYSNMRKIYDEYNLTSYKEYLEFIETNKIPDEDTPVPFRRVSVNQAFMDLIGLEDENEFLEGEIHQFIDESSIDAFMNSVDQSLRGKNSVTFNAKILRKDGREITSIIRRSIDPNTPIPWQRVYTTVLDVSELDEAYRKVEENEIKYRTLYETAQDAIFLINPISEEIVDCNNLAAQLRGSTKENLLGKKLSEISNLTSEDILSKKGNEKSQVRKFSSLDGEDKYVEFSSKMIMVSKEPILIVFLRDVTEKLESERILQDTRERLFQAQKMEAIGRMSGGIAHDFNNLLTLINLNAEILDQELEENQELNPLVKEIISGIQKASLITSDLLLFSRNRILKRETVELHEIIENFTKTFRKFLPKNISYIINNYKGTLFASVDPIMLEQVFLNLGLNAIDALPDGGQISISTNLIPAGEHEYLSLPYPEELISIRFNDNGMGMTEEVVAKIFEPFFTTKEKKGTGLGLANVYTIIRGFDGFIEVTSKPNKGTTFELFLPVAKSKETTEREKNLKKRGPKKANAKILVIDDDENIRAIIKKILESYGLEVEVAINGEDGLQKFQLLEDLDLVITDIKMAIMSGKELVKEIRKLNTKIPVIYITGFTQDFNEVLKSKKSNERILQKPFQSEQLLNEIKALVGLSIDI